MKKSLLLILSVLFYLSGTSQTTRGTEFWVNFFHNIVGDSMFVIVAAPNGANVTVDMPASTFSSALILNANELRKVYIPSSFEPSSTDTANKFGIHVSSDKEIIVYALSAGPASTDATCVIPESAQPNLADFTISSHVSTGGTNARPNVFSIVPHDSSILVEITPSSLTSSGRLANVPYTKLLHKGDVYIVRNNTATGLDGSYVRVLSPGKKVSVYQGNDCIAVDCGACDHLFEVVPPSSVYGKNFVLNPFFGAGNGYHFNVMGTKSGTIVTRNGFAVDTLDAGEQYTEKMAQDSSLCISTSEPAIVMQMMIGCNSLSTGDPAYLYVVPLEQTLTNAIISTSNTTIIKEHFINVLLPKPGIQRFFLDGVKIPSTSFNQVYCGDFYFYSDTVAPGSHTVQCDDGFIANVYGMGGFESYAYFAGASLRNLQLSFESKVIPNCDTGVLVKFYPNPDTLTRYQWEFPANAVADSDTIKYPTVYFPVAGNYTVKLAGYSPELGWDSTQQITHVLDTTASDFIPFRDAIICRDSYTFELPGSEAYSFLWNTGDTGALLTIKAGGQYSVIGTNRFTNCIIKDTADVVMHDKVETSFGFHMDKFCPGYPLELHDSSKLGNDTIKSWEWFADFVSFSNKQNDTISSPRANNYDVMLKIITNKGCVDSLQKRINVDDFPVARFGLQIKDSCINRGSIVGNNTSSILLGKFKNFVWEYSDGEKVINGVPFKEFKDTGLHWVRLWAESEGGCVDTAKRQFVRIYPAPVPKAALVDSFVCLAKNQFFFSNQTTDTATINYEWHWGDGSGTVLKDPPPKVYADTGAYEVELVAGYNKTGCTDTFSKNIRVLEAPIAKLAVDSFSECLGKNYFAFRDDSDPKGGVNKYYRWIWGDGTETNDTSNPTKRFALAGNYKLTYIFSTGKGCEDTTYKNMNVYTSPIAQFDLANAKYCQQDNSIDFVNNSVGPANMRFDWWFDDGTSSVLKTPLTKNYADTGTYVISLRVLDPLIQCRDTFERAVSILRNPKSKASVKDSLLCVTGNSFQFEDTAQQEFSGGLFKWIFSDGDSAIGSSVTKQFLNPGDYTAQSIVYNGPACSDTSTINVRVGARTNTKIVALDTLLCKNENKIDLWNTYISGPSISTLSWNNGWLETVDSVRKSFPLGNNIIMAFTLNSELCRDTALMNILVVPKPVSLITNALADQQCLLNNSYAFSASTNLGLPAYQYNWMVNGVNTSGSNTYNYSYTESIKDTVQLVTIDQNNCKDTAQYPVEVFEQPVVDFVADSICPEEEITFNAMVNPSGIPNLQFIWDLGDGNTSTTNPVKHSYSGKDIDYRVQVIVNTPNGCADTSVAKVVRVFDVPLARFSFSALTPTSGAIPYEFRDSSLGALTHFWSLDQTTSSETKFIHNFDRVGQQLVSLMVENGEGCRDSTSQLILVESPSRIFIPNTFSPNGDNRNELFGPEALAPVKEYYFAIFNRWGEKLFETKDPTMKWDGTYRGERVMQGNYMYMVNLVYQNETRFKTEGQVLLLE